MMKKFDRCSYSQLTPGEYAIIGDSLADMAMFRIEYVLRNQSSVFNAGRLAAGSDSAGFSPRRVGASFRTMPVTGVVTRPVTAAKRRHLAVDRKSSSKE